jgi:hypothetical protein
MIIHFIKKIIIFSAILASISFLLFAYAIPQYYLPVFPFLLAFFVVSTIAVHALLSKAGKHKTSRFSAVFMGSITAKLFLYILFIIIYILIDKSTAVPFLVAFLILYFLFTFFETVFLLKDLNKAHPPNRAT